MLLKHVSSIYAKLLHRKVNGEYTFDNVVFLFPPDNVEEHVSIPRSLEANSSSADKYGALVIVLKPETLC